MEPVRGEECYIFDPKYPEAAPIQNTILPFTRNLHASHHAPFGSRRT